MKFTLPNAILALAIAAQSASADSTSTCEAQNILEACLATTKGYLDQCQSTDYQCLCDKYTAIMTCFNNCPNDDRAPSYQNSKTLYCMNASLYASMTAKPVTATSQSAAVPAKTTTSGDAGQGAQTGSSTSSSTPPKDTNAAGDLSAHRGGVLAAVAGVIAAAAVL